MAVTSLAQNNPVPLHNNYLTGYFGTGRRVFIPESTTFIAPITGKYRVRVWGGGSSGYINSDGTTTYECGHSGGFALKEIELQEGDQIEVTVAVKTSGYSQNGMATSFGSYVSATGGTLRDASNSGDSGDGIGGDLNIKGAIGIASTSTSAAKAAANGLSMLYPFINSTEFKNNKDIDVFEYIQSGVSNGSWSSSAGAGYVIVEY